MVSPNSNSVISSFSLLSILEKEKLNGNKYLYLERNLRIVLKSEMELNVLENSLLAKPPFERLLRFKKPMIQ